MDDNDDIDIPFDEILDGIHADQRLGPVRAYKPCAGLFQNPQELVKKLIRDARYCNEVGTVLVVAPKECQLSDTQKKEFEQKMKALKVPAGNPKYQKIYRAFSEKEVRVNFLHVICSFSYIFDLTF